MNNKTLRYNNSIRFLLRGATLLILLLVLSAVFGISALRAQTVSEGLYYIGSRGYNANNPATNYYLCPTEDWYYYYSSFPKYRQSNNGQPFMTTYQCRNGEYDSKKALWVVKQSPTANYFYIIHLVDGKYLTYNDSIRNGTSTNNMNNAGRMRVHIEDTADGEKALFQFVFVSQANGYSFVSKKAGPDNNNRKYLNVTGDGSNSGNQPYLYGTDAKKDGPGGLAVGGIIGLWTTGANDANGRWYPESTLLTAPSIGEVSPTTGRVTVTDVNGLDDYNIHYTVSSDPDVFADPTLLEDPTASSDVMPAEGYLLEETCIIKAVVEKYGVVLTSVATSGTLEPTIPSAPTVTINCDNTFSLICDNMPEVYVYYTLTTNGDDPADPTIGSPRFTDPVEYQAGYKIKAKAIQDGGNSSSIASYEFTSADIHTEAPVITLAATTATITAPGATIYYTINGTDPTTSSSVYSEPLTISETADVDIRAIAQVSGQLVSCVTRADRPSKPTLTVTDGDCSPLTDANTVTLTAPNDGRTLWYTYTAGNNSAAPNPDVTAYVQYTEPVSVSDLDGSNAYYTFHAYAQSSDGLFKSSVVSVSHEMKTAGRPELTPPVGSNPVITISGGVFGDFAVCSASGVAVQNIPIASDGTAEYTIAPEATGTLTVAFRHGNWQPSCEATYVLPAAPATPTYSQDCADLLSLACETPMANIHYTTGDNENPPTSPTLDDPTYFPGCLDNLTFGTQIKAKAFIGFRASGELSFTYTRTHSATPQFFVEGTTVVISVPDDDHATIYYNFSTNHNNTMPDYPDDATTESPLYETSYTLDGITIFSAIAVQEGLLPSCPVTAVTREGYSINSATDLSKLSDHPDKYFFIFNDIDDASSYETVENFTGVIEGNNYTINGLKMPLFKTATNAVIHDLNLADVNISAEGHVGAIAQTANGNTRIYNCGILGESSSVTTSSTEGDAYVGGLVGLLDGYARVINCFSYADITGGTHRAGIVGYNNYASKSGDLRTMVMNCMFYGEISTDGNPTIYPVYGGLNIHNKRTANNNTGLNNYCYFYYHGDYVNHIDNNNYHGSLGSEERFLNRFEFFRQTLNSTRNMAAYYISGVATETELVAKWVLDKSIAPYPILKAPGYYPSIVNHDAEHAVPIDPDNVHYNEGRKLGSLTVNIQKGTGGAVFNNASSSISTDQLILNITDKDFDHDDYTSDYYDFNYKKVQLPYYNQVGEGNYTKVSDTTGLVVTGWKIVAISPTGSGSFTTDTLDYPHWNFVDRTCTEKDLYSKSGRVFSQGAYWEVPDGVTSITIEPYWAKAVYLSDAYYDVTYSGSNKYGVTVAGACPTTYNEQKVYNSITGNISAITALNIEENRTVYDYAVVLVGNYHQYANNALYTTTENKPVTFMSADLDGDCEPDYTLFYYHQARKRVAPIRFDFLNMPGIGMVKRTWDSDIKPEPGIFKPAGWFEITNTVNVRFGQFEYFDGGNDYKKLHRAPLILQGGIYEQFVSSMQGDAPAKKTNYLLVGGNSWFKNFANGCHTANPRQTPKAPISVTGGDYENFYLTGIYQSNINPTDENVVCYIDGGRFSEVAGAGMQRVDGNATWVINAADMEKFFGGGINPAQSIQGNITTTISNSRVTDFYGGPKFGEMQDNKDVTTTATNCRFGLFFGAGYGGTAYNRVGCEDVSAKTDTPPWEDYVNEHYSRGYETTHHSNNGSGADIPVNAISTNYEYEYILHSDGEQTVARFFVNFAALSLASTKNVITNLTGCNIGRFYGGGRLGTVYGNVTSTLTDCIVDGDVFGSGFSAEAPDIMVMKMDTFEVAPKYNRRAGVFNDAEVKFPSVRQYYWKHTTDVLTPESTVFEYDSETDKYYILTNVNLDNLGAVLGNTTLTINGNRTVIGGDVYGGGALSSTSTEKTIQVNINEGTYGSVDEGIVTGGNIYGGGKGDLASLATETDPDHSNIAVTEGNVVLKIGNDSQSANSVVIKGNVYGCNNYNGSPQGNVSVDVYVTKHNSSNTASNTNGGYAIANVFGGGHLADYTPAGKTASVTIHGCENTIGRVFGGGDAAAAPGVVTVIDGGRFDWVFGGGNGEVIAANIGDGGANLTVHGGKIHHLFGGSNERGTISGDMIVNIDNSSGCDEYIDEFFGGCNLVELGTPEDPISLSTTIGCGTMFGSVYGGSNKANINGNVTLTIAGGEIDYVYGGSKGVAVGDETYPEGLSADISGDVTLNLTGGTISNAFGGSNILGSINGDITVNVEDAEDQDCPLVLTNVFGGGNLAVYSGSPAVNVKHGTVLGNVYGGGNGDPADNTQAKGSTGAPTVTIGDDDTDHQAIVVGDVYGGGNAAKVTGNVATSVHVLNKCNTEIQGAVYGGGNMALVPATSVSIAGGTIGDVFGGGHGDNDPEHSVAANVTGNTSVSVTGATIDRVFAGANLNGNIGGTMALSIDKSDEANCDMIIREVYGGGNMAAGKAAEITIGCTGSIVDGESGHVAHPENIGTSLEGIGTLYGGANQANIGTSENQSDITLNINSGIINKVFGGNNTSGEIYGDITVNIEKTSDACGWYVGDVFGGGDHAYYDGTPDVNIIAGTVYRNVYGGGNDITTANKGVNGSDVEMTGGTVLGSVYGGCNTRGVVVNNAQVSITSGTIGSATALASGIVSKVYGGGLGANTQVKGNVTVTIDSTAGVSAPEIWGDVYGGSEFGSVNTISNGNTTTVNIYNGHFKQKAINGTSPITSQDTTYYYGGNIYGGGLGDAGDVNKGKVNGVITVNVGQINPSSGGKGDQDDIDYIGEATIEGNVYGCNNTNGSPQDSVVVNIFHTAHVLADTVGNNEPDAPYAIANVFGGGNLADYTASTKKARVNIFGCDNTIRRVFGGGNAAAAPTVVTDIKGGRFNEVFGGGNGEVSPANITGNVILGIHGGNVKEFYGGSNQQGNITGTTEITVDDTGCDYVSIDEFFCGGKFANYSGNINATITCSEGMNVKNLYGGCKQAHVVPNGNDPNAPGYEPGNIHLIVKGGTYENIYGGSQGTPSEPANIAGSVTLEVLGGTVTHAIFGGSNINGNIGGTITVRVEQGAGEDVCPLDAKLADVYGGGNQADYSTPEANHDYPDVTIKNAMVKNVYGGGLEAEVQGNPQIKIKKGSKILGNVYGGGNMGEVDGNPRVIINGKME